MTQTFVDTSFLLALASESDELHERALDWQQYARGDLLTTEYVLVEIGDALCHPENRPLAISILHDLEQSPRVEIVPAGANLLHLGRTLFEQRPDKNWGLTDCISFEIMRQRGILDALTHDHHFEQAGFRALLRQDPPSN
jgi:uncharacterized protein